MLSRAIVRDADLKNGVTAAIRNKCAEKNMARPLRTGRTALENHLLPDCLGKPLECPTELGELIACSVSVLPRSIAIVLDENLDVRCVIFDVVVLVNANSHGRVVMPNVM